MCKKWVCILAVITGCLAMPAWTEVPEFNRIRPEAIATLQSEMRDGDGPARAEAAATLLMLGYLDGVEAAFPDDSSLYESDPAEQISAWRVQALLAADPLERRERIRRIKSVFFDKQSVHRLDALEALARTGVRLTDDQLDEVRRFSNQTSDPAAFWLLAQHGDVAAVAGLKQCAGSEDRQRAGLATYILARLHVDPDDESRLIRARRIVSEPHSERVMERLAALHILASVGTVEDLEILSPLLADADASVRVAAAGALLRMERRRDHRMGFLDGAVIGGYFLSLILIGWYYARKTKTADEYLLGGRNMKSWMVGLSLFAALLSTASYMSVPGEIVKHGPMILAQLTAIPLVIWVVGWFLIPAFMRLRVTSANELLEMRMGLSVRMLGSAFFLFARFAWMAMIIYITAKAVMGPVMGLGPEMLPWMCILLGVITMAYTSSGGLKAAVLADVIQSFILYFGAILTIALVSVRLGGLQWFPTTWAPTWDPPVFWFDARARVTFAGAGMMMFFWYICTAGSDQVAVQRYLATRDLKAARSAFNFNLLAVTLVLLFLGVMGFALYGYFLANPHELADGMNIRTDADRIFPHFIVSGLPPGVSGLIAAALLAAALSSLSAGLNSTGTVVTVDFLDRFSTKKQGEKEHVRRARRVSLAIGVLVVLLSLLVDRVEGNFTEVVNKLANLLSAPLFLLFFMAIFVPWATAPGTWVGAIISVFVAVGIAFFGIFGLSFIWIVPCSLISGVITGSLVSLLVGKKRAPLKREQD